MAGYSSYPTMSCPACTGDTGLVRKGETLLCSDTQSSIDVSKGLTASITPSSILLS